MSTKGKPYKLYRNKVNGREAWIDPDRSAGWEEVSKPKALELARSLRPRSFFEEEATVQPPKFRPKGRGRRSAAQPSSDDD